MSDTESWNEKSTWLLTVAAVLIAAAAPALYIMMIRLVVSIVTLIVTGIKTFRRTPNVTADDERTPLNPGVLRWTPYNKLRKVLWSSRTPDGTVIELGKFIQDVWSDASPRGAIILAILSIILIGLCLAFFICIAIGGIISAGILTDDVVLSDSPDCGVWVAKGEFDGEILRPMPSFYYFQEQEATDYARRCFGASEGGDEGCSCFTVPNLEVNEKDHTPCPFAEDLCLRGSSSAYTLTTNNVSSKDLGINVPTGFIFSRTTTCVPLKRDGYVKLSQDGATYEYHYGPNAEVGTPTWTSQVNQSWNFPGYSLETVFYGQTKNISKRAKVENYWKPIAEFNPETNNLITLLFVQSQENYYADKRLDPIFPAESPVTSPSDGSLLYYNSDSMATVLACVDKQVTCHSSGAPCYEDIGNPPTEDCPLIEKMGYYMLLLSLMRSTISDAVMLQGGSALDASSKLSGNLSLPLAKEQWKVEARKAFKSSLARMLITLRDFVRGAAAHEDEFEDWTDSGYHEFCRSWKFRAEGWKNVSVTGLVILILSTILVYALGFDFEGPEDDDNRDSSSNAGQGVGYGGIGRSAKDEESKPSKLGVEYVWDLLCFLVRKGRKGAARIRTRVSSWWGKGTEAQTDNAAVNIRTSTRQKTRAETAAENSRASSSRNGDVESGIATSGDHAGSNNPARDETEGTTPSPFVVGEHDGNDHER